MADTTTIDHFRQALGAVDPAALTNADQWELMLLIQASMEAAGLE